MTDTIVICAFGVLTAVLLCVVIALLLSLKKKAESKDFSGEFSINREEAARSAKETREEISKGLEKVDARLGEMTKENFNSRLELSDKLGKSLSEIQKKLFSIGDEIVILADSSKYEKSALLKVSDMNPCYTYISDTKLSEEIKAVYRNNDINIITKD